MTRPWRNTTTGPEPGDKRWTCKRTPLLMTSAMDFGLGEIAGRVGGLGRQEVPARHDGQARTGDRLREALAGGTTARAIAVDAQHGKIDRAQLLVEEVRLGGDLGEQARLGRQPMQLGHQATTSA